MSIQKCIQKVLAQFGFVLVRESEFSIVPRGIKISGVVDEMSVLEVAVRALISELAGILPTVVQVGACDGVVGDPLHPIIRRHSLPSVLIEPVPASFARLSRTYSGMANTRLMNVAIHDTCKAMTMFTVNEAQVYRGATGKDGGWGPQLASFDRNHLLKRGVAPEIILEQDVRCMTLREVCEEASVTSVDILQVDAEGYDSAVVRMGLALNPSPAVIHFEHVHLRHDDMCGLLEELRNAGYRICRHLNNTLCMLEARRT